MPTDRSSGRSNKLTGQLGEYLVAAELARRGLIATTFTGNVPHYDIIASDARGRHVSVQVKASNSDNWQFAINKFCKVTFQGDRQRLGSGLRTPVRRLVVVLVQVAPGGGRDKFYICTWQSLRNILVRQYRDWLRSHKGRRPKNPRSFHTVATVPDLRRFEDCWATVRSSLS